MTRDVDRIADAIAPFLDVSDRIVAEVAQDAAKAVLATEPDASAKAVTQALVEVHYRLESEIKKNVEAMKALEPWSFSFGAGITEGLFTAAALVRAMMEGKSMSQHAHSHPEIYEEHEPTHVARCYHRLRGRRCELDGPHPEEVHQAFVNDVGLEMFRWDSTESDPR